MLFLRRCAPLTRGGEAPPGDGGERDGARADPDNHDEGGRPLVAHLDGVVERVRDGPVPSTSNRICILKI